jgi:hypothetical protein
MLVRLTAILLLAMPPAVGAADWVFVAQSVDGTEYSIDREGVKLISRDEELVEVWQKVSSPLMRINLAYNNHRNRVHHDCVAHKAEVVESCTYHSERKQGCSLAADSWKPVEPQHLRPGSVGYAVHRTVCSLGIPDRKSVV